MNQRFAHNRAPSPRAGYIFNRFAGLFVGIAIACAGCAQGAAPQTPCGQAPPPSADHPGGSAMHHHEHGDHSGHEPLVHRFQKAEEWAAVFDDPARDAWQRPAVVVEKLGLGQGMSVADIGAGTGYFLPYLSRAVGAQGLVLGLDIEADMVRYMRERASREHLGNVRAQIVLPDDPELLPQSIDRILIVDTWHHIPERPAYAAKLRQALKPNGVVMIVDFTLESDKGPPKHHRIQSDQVVRELGEGGLRAEPIEESLPDQYIVAGKAPP